VKAITQKNTLEQVLCFDGGVKENLKLLLATEIHRDVVSQFMRISSQFGGYADFVYSTLSTRRGIPKNRLHQPAFVTQR
jgi:hypothetical protein